MQEYNPSNYIFEINRGGKGYFLHVSKMSGSRRLTKINIPVSKELLAGWIKDIEQIEKGVE
ncbi:MAG: hypothetical protein ABFD07_02950 [Methanobacterium sp.]